MNSFNDKDPSELAEDLETIKSICTDLINENADLKNALEAKERELDLLYTLNRRVNFTLDLEEIQEVVVELIRDFFPVVSLCVIALYADDNELMLTMKDRDNPVKLETLKMNVDIDETTNWDDIVATNEWNDYISKIVNIREMRSSFIPLSFNEREHGFMMVCKLLNMEYGEDEWRFLSTTASYVGMTVDNSRLDKMARTDALTGLFNRWLFIHRLDRLIERAAPSRSPVAVLSFDIDRFKSINDEYGHPAGDQVLVELANRLKSAIQEGENVFRVGGEEMIILAPRLSLDEAYEKAESVRMLIGNTPFEFNSVGSRITKTITISCGVAAYPDNADDSSSLISRADQALYKAKTNGRNRVEKAQ